MADRNQRPRLFLSAEERGRPPATIAEVGSALRELVLDPGAFDQRSDIDLGALLASDTAVIFEALRTASPPPGFDLFSETSPILSALVRIMTPGSWLVLRADHLAIMLENGTRPMGFADLVIAEGTRILAETSVSQPFREMKLLIGALLKHHGADKPGLTHTVQRYMATVASALKSQGQIEEARSWLSEAKAMPNVPQDDETELRLLQAAGHHEEALRVSLRCSPVRELEVLAELAFERRDATGQDFLARLISASRMARRVARSKARDLVRAHSLCHAGWHLARLARLFLDRWPPDEPQPDLSIVAELAEELESAESLVRSVGGELAEGFWLLVLGRLRLHYTPLRAVEPLRRSAELLAACGASSLARDAREALVEATGERPRRPDGSTGSSGSPLSTQAFPPDTAPKRAN